MDLLSQEELTSRKYHISTVIKVETDASELLALLWIDEKSGRFVSSHSGTPKKRSIEQTKWKRKVMALKFYSFRSQLQRFWNNIRKPVIKLTHAAEVDKIP